MLADLVARRRQIVEMIAAESQRARRLTSARLQKSIARLRKALEKELAELDGEIDDAVRGSPAWREKEDLLASVPGIGPTIARTLIAELPELGRSTAGRSQPLPGSPRGPGSPANGEAKASSAAAGQNVRRGPVHGRHGRRPIQPDLKLSATASSPPAKPKLVAIIAVARKLLTILNAILRDKTPWQPKTLDPKDSRSPLVGEGGEHERSEIRAG